MMGRSSRPNRSLETAVCAWMGHFTPGATAAPLDDGRSLLGVEMGERHSSEAWRLVRCLRCESWVAAAQPPPHLVAPPPDLDSIELPRRGRALRQAVIMRLISVERGAHSVFFTLLAGLAIALRVELAGVKSWVRHLLAQLTSNASGTNAVSGSYLVKEGNHLLELKSTTLEVVIVVAVAYAVVEGVEAVGLWRERRWAEYLTVVATAGLLPYEIYELANRATAFKIGALIVNVAVLVYLVWAKRLFGLARLRPLDPSAHEGPVSYAGPSLARPVAGG